MQKIECFNCGKPLNLNIKASTGYIYEAKPGRDDKPRARLDKDGKPVKVTDSAPPLFHVHDRKTMVKKVESKEKGIAEDVATEEPNAKICPHCGFVNKIY